jgi:hypothetical protein
MRHPGGSSNPSTSCALCNTENATDRVDQIRADRAVVVILDQPFQPLVADTANLMADMHGLTGQMMRIGQI